MLTDAVLVERVIAGFDDAFDELYRRHATAAWRLGQAVTGNPHDAADAVSEAFARVLQAVKGGRLEDGAAFRSYLLTATRNAALDGMRRSGRTRPTDTDDMATLESGSPSPDDKVVDGADAALIASAFRNLPERWRSVLWLTEVEGVATKDAAEQLGLSANGAAQLAVRARAGLRERYLQAHLRDAGDADCRFTVDRLGAYVGGGLSARDIAKVDQHLAGCEDCAARKAELEDVGTSLRRIAFPLPLALGGLASDRVRTALTASVSAVPVATGAARMLQLAKEPTPFMRRLVGASAAGVLGLGVLAASFLGGPDQVVADLAAPKIQGPLREVTFPEAPTLARATVAAPSRSFARPAIAAPAPATGGTTNNLSTPGGPAPEPAPPPPPAEEQAPAATKPETRDDDAPILPGLDGILPPLPVDEPISIGIGGNAGGTTGTVTVEVDETPAVEANVGGVEIAPLGSADEETEAPEEDGLSIQLGGEEILGLP